VRYCQYLWMGVFAEAAMRVALICLMPFSVAVGASPALMVAVIGLAAWTLVVTSRLPHWRADTSKKAQAA
jgi:hypothetical protein